MPGKVHGLRSLVGYSPWSRKESDTTERLHFTSLHFTSLQGSIYSHTMLIKTPLLHQSLDPCVFSFFLFLSFFLSFSFFLFLSFFSFFLSLSISLSPYFWLIPWSTKASSVTRGILASFLFSLSHHRLWTTRFQFNQGPTTAAQNRDSGTHGRFGRSNPRGAIEAGKY